MTSWKGVGKLDGYVWEDCVVQSTRLCGAEPCGVPCGASDQSDRQRTCFIEPPPALTETRHHFERGGAFSKNGS